LIAIVEIMGSAAVKETHLMRYGAAAATSSEPRVLTKVQLEQSAARLAEPKRRSALARQQSTTTGSPQAAARGMEQLFPIGDSASDDDDTIPTLRFAADDRQFGLVASPYAYPTDWRQLPSPPVHRAGVEWIYAWASMERQETAEQTFAAASKSIIKQLTARGVNAADNLTTRREVRSMVRSPQRVGVLVDIVATRRRLLSGEPHEAASRLYRFVEEKYPVACVFMAVGITDNRAKRVARDILNTDPVAGAKKLGFADVDNEHMMVVYPLGNEGDAIRERGYAITQEREEARRRRTCTPKYIPPPQPDFVAAAEERRRATTPLTKLERPPSRQSDVPDCARCWRHERRVEITNISRSESRTPATTPAPTCSQEPELAIAQPTRDDVDPIARLRHRTQPGQPAATWRRMTSTPPVKSTRDAVTSVGERRATSRHRVLHRVVDLVARRNSLSPPSSL
jgi:hypothetical protein